MASVAALLSTSPSWAQVTPGFDFEVDAGLDDGTNTIWEASPGTTGTNIEFALDATVVWGAIGSTSTQLTHAYDFPGGTVPGASAEGGVDGGKLSKISEGPGECYSFFDGPTPGGWDTQDVTIEIWFRPDNLTPPDGGYVLWEDGGGTGFGLFITNNELITSQDTDQAEIAYNLSTDPSIRLTAAATAEFIQCVVTRTAAGATEMFINGVSVGTASDGDGDWSGGDGFGLGARGEANMGGRGSVDGTGADGTTRSFDGEIALFRVYNNQVLTPAEVLANYDALSGPDTTNPVLISVSPADDATDAPLDDLVASFSEPVDIATGEIRIVNETDVVTTTITLPDPTQVTALGTNVTISPAVALLGGKNYHIEIDATAVDDLAGNSYDGFVDPTIWNFSTDGTPPTLVSITDNKPGGQIYDNNSVVYTVTFNEAMNSTTIDTGDFGNSASGTATVTVDSVTPVSETVYEMVVSPTSTGTIELQINAAANLEDIAGNALDTSAAILDDNVVTVLPFVANSASMALDFQETVASEEYDDIVGGSNPYGATTPGRFWHVSVNPNNVGYASYIALNTAHNAAVPPFVRTFTNPVLGWSWVGGGTNGDLTISEESGGLVSWTTTDETDPVTNTFDSFGMNQKKFWNATDPGPDISLPANEADVLATTHDKNITGYRSFGQATATIDVSSVEEGLLIIFYGAFSATPVVDAVLRDSSGLEPDVVLADLHANGDFALRTEYYVAEVSFDTEGVYDTIVYNYLQPGGEPDGSGNGRSGGLVVLGPEPITDYTTWASLYPAADLSDPDGDFDGDGLTNDDERLFGLNPTSGASVDPMVVPFDAAAGTFSFTRRDPALTGKFTDIETSFGLDMWTNDSGAMLTVSGTVDDVQTVDVVLSPGLLTAPKLFVRVNQNDGIVFSENFEDDNGGFTLTGAPNDWAYGTPNANNGAGLILTSGNGGSTNCWATVLGDSGLVGSGAITLGSDSILRSPNIDLASAAGAQLQFAAAIDGLSADTLEVLVREVGTDALLETVNPVTLPFSSKDWANFGPFPIPGAAGSNVYLEFRFVGTDTDYIGFYLDDVSVSKVAP